MLPLLFVLSAFADDPRSSVADAVRRAVAGNMGTEVEDVEVSALGVLPENLPDTDDWAVTFANSRQVTGNVRLTVRSGTVRLALLPHIVVWRDLPVAAANVAPGKRVPVTSARVSSDDLAGPMVEGDGPWVARVGLKEGAALSAVNVRPAPDLLKGATVVVQARVGEVFITAHGEVLADAMVGEEVAVLNRATRSVQRGVYEGDLIVVLEQ